MRLNDQNIALANKLRKQIQRETETIGDGEAIAMTLLWGFLIDHSAAMNEPLEQLAMHQMEAYIQHARKNVRMVRGSNE